MVAGSFLIIALGLLPWVAWFSVLVSPLLIIEIPSTIVLVPLLIFFSMFAIVISSAPAASVLFYLTIILAHALLVSFAIVGEIILIPLGLFSPLLIIGGGIIYAVG